MKVNNLAAGYATRLYPLTLAQPKPLWNHAVGNQPHSPAPTVQARSENSILAAPKRETCDVLLSYNSTDRRTVLRLAGALKQRGIRCWIDVEQIPSGECFQEILQTAVAQAHAAAIVLGPNGLGRWQTLELRAIISQSVERTIPVIPVLLPGIETIPRELLFLRELNWVKFRKTLQEQGALNHLVCGITGQRP